MGSSASSEIWRRGDKFGYRAPLLSRLAASLKGSGYEDDIFENSDEDQAPGDLQADRCTDGCTDECH